MSNEWEEVPTKAISTEWEDVPTEVVVSEHQRSTQGVEIKRPNDTELGALLAQAPATEGSRFTHSDPDCSIDSRTYTVASSSLPVENTNFYVHTTKVILPCTATESQVITQALAGVSKPLTMDEMEQKMALLRLEKLQYEVDEARLRKEEIEIRINKTKEADAKAKENAAKKKIKITKEAPKEVDKELPKEVDKASAREAHKEVPKAENKQTNPGGSIMVPVTLILENGQPMLRLDKLPKEYKYVGIVEDGELKPVDVPALLREYYALKKTNQELVTYTIGLLKTDQTSKRMHVLQSTYVIPTFPLDLPIAWK